MRTILLLLLLATTIQVHGQTTVQNLNEVQPDTTFENIHVQKVSTDDNASTFIIWVNQGVKAHYHAKHTENLVVIEGTGEMTINDKTYNIGPGDYIYLPEGTIHSVKVTSDVPLKVISIQAPAFLGKDRIFVE